VAIARAIHFNARILIMHGDELTLELHDPPGSYFS
jgi:ABC-type sugar transport system ATPase subunit